jgi:hypothetical protein
MIFLRVLIATLAVFALAAVATATAPAKPSRPTVLSAPEAKSAIPFSRLRLLARKYVNFKIFRKEITKEVGKEALHELLVEGRCSALLPARFFCPSKPPVWGLGFALNWGGRSPGVWNSPSSPRRLIRLQNGGVYTLRPGVLYWLTCYAYGDKVSDGGIVTRLWYRLRSRGWVNDGWVDTGTNYVIPGVRHC